LLSAATTIVHAQESSDKPMQPLRCRLGLNGLSFFIAAVQTGFGPFFSVYLTEQGWSQVDIGFALSVGTGAVLISQLPAGTLVDLIHQKRLANGLGLLLVGVSALVLIMHPTPGPVWLAQAIHAVGSCILDPAIAALTLVLVGHAAFSERLGVNARYASLGNATAAAALGALASYVSERAVFIATAAMVIPALACLPLFRSADRVADDDHPALLHPKERLRRKHHPWHIFDEGGLHTFAVCAMLFSFANAAMLPLALNELAKRSTDTGFTVSAAIIVPQIIVAVFSPFVGRFAERVGRRPVLLFGFAALPLRGLLFVTMPSAGPLVVMQALDGVSGAVFGLMIPLIAADLTRKSGYLNLAISSLNLAIGLGAMFSTTLAGWVADTLGAPAAFLGLTIVGFAAVAVLWALMPETKPLGPFTTTPAAVAA
jgi:MFS family permease